MTVFVGQLDEQASKQLLVRPVSPKAVVPPQYQVGWVYYGTFDTGNEMFGDINPAAIEIEIANTGFAVVQPEAAERSIA